MLNKRDNLCHRRLEYNNYHRNKFASMFFYRWMKIYYIVLRFLMLIFYL